MQAIRQHPPGGPASLDYEQVATPQPGPGETLVRVHAAAITRDELGWAADRLPAIPSYELSGVTADGEAVFALGDFDRDGAAAEYVAVRTELLAPKPRKLDHVESAALPLAGLTAWQGLFVHGGLSEGQRVLIHGAAGGVGHLAVQLARARGAYVIGTASAANAEAVRALGADEAVEPSSFTAIEPVELVFDTAGGERLARSPDVLAAGGRIVSVAEEPPIGTYFVVEPSREQLAELARLADEGSLRPAVDAVFPLADARAAFERSEGGAGRGKLVLRVRER